MWLGRWCCRRSRIRSVRCMMGFPFPSFSIDLDVSRTWEDWPTLLNAFECKNSSSEEPKVGSFTRHVCGCIGVYFY